MARRISIVSDTLSVTFPGLMLNSLRLISNLERTTSRSPFALPLLRSESLPGRCVSVTGTVMDFVIPLRVISPSSEPSKPFAVLVTPDSDFEVNVIVS